MNDSAVTAMDFSRGGHLLTAGSTVGPYTNIGATLRLTSSGIRNEAKKDASITAVPLRHTVSVPVSAAQTDADVFEFGFRDERYMPFEGAGAIDSEWKISLPDQYRAFDYQTISDVILHISYTASEDPEFRKKVEAENGQLAAMLRALPSKRLFCLRSEFPSAWAGFKSQKTSDAEFGELKIELGPAHYSFWRPRQVEQRREGGALCSDSRRKLVVREKPNERSTEDIISERDGKLLKGELTNNKPQSPIGDLRLFLSDSSIADLWLLIAWSQ